MAQMTFVEFRESRTEGNQRRFEEFGLESFFHKNNDDVRDIYLYADTCYIMVLNTGEFLLHIEVHEWIDDDVEKLERILYEEWYLKECA